MARLILHSDDLGLHGEVNRGIFEAAQKGVLTSASMLVNGLAVNEAIEGARQCPNLGIGLHLNILRGRPISDPREVPSLVDSSGKFFNSVYKLLMRSISRWISREEVLKEYQAQLQFMLDRGITPTHFDGEKHTHLLLPEAVWAVRRMAEDSGVKRVRLVNETVLIDILGKIGFSTNAKFTQYLKLRLLEWRSQRARADWCELKSPSMFYGVSLSGGEGYASADGILEAILSIDNEAVVEWMFHVGYPFDSSKSEFKDLFGSFFLNQSRYDELRFLLSSSVKNIIERHRGQLITYNEL